MSIANVNSALIGAYQYANKTQKNNAAEKNSFADMVKHTAGSGSTDRTEAYKDYLKQKYGNVRYESVGKDQKSLDRAAERMSGNDVVIAPNIVEEMANDSEKAAYYEGKIDDFFNDIPRKKAMSAAMGMVYEPCGVIIHEDGSVTYCSRGSNDTPETRAKIKAEQAAKRGRRERYQELSEEAAEKHRELAEWQYQKQFMSDVFQRSSLIANANYHFITQAQMPVATAAYESAISTYSSSAMGNIL